MRWIVTLPALLVSCGAAGAGETPGRSGPTGGRTSRRTTEGVGLTIYSSSRPPERRWAGGGYVTVHAGYATVKEWRRMTLERGVSVLRFTDVAREIRPATVLFTSLTDPEGAFVREQNYEYDLVSGDKLLAKYVDREVTFLREDADGKVTEETVTLLSVSGGGCVVRRDDPENPIEILNEMPRVRLGALPGGLITRPTLVWSVRARRAGEHLCKVVYETGGVGWKAAYTAVVGAADATVDLSGWVTITNSSGKTYSDAEIKLVAGDVRERGVGRGGTGTTGGAWGTMKTRDGGFREKRFFEHRLYTLGRKSTVRDNSKKQLELFRPATGVPARKMLVYFGATGWDKYSSSPRQDRGLGTRSNRSVDVYLAFRNSADAGLGIPLPAGTVRVYKEDPDDGSLEFIGEDNTEHSSRDEDIMLRLGSAFDLAGERRQTDFKCKYNERWIVESFEITVRNHKDEAARVLVREVLYRWVNWDITAKSDEFTKKDWRTIHFPVDVPANGEKTITYTVRYTW